MYKLPFISICLRISETLPRRKDFIQHFPNQLSISTLQKHIEIISNLKYLPKLHQIPHAAALQLRQLVKRRVLQPLQNVLRVDILQQALMAGLFQIRYVVLVSCSEKGQPVGQELLVPYAAVDVVQEGSGSFD